MDWAILHPVCVTRQHFLAIVTPSSNIKPIKLIPVLNLIIFLVISKFHDNVHFNPLTTLSS